MFILHYLYRLSAPPETLDQLGDSLALLEQLQQDLPNIEAKFPPLHQQFAILEKYEVAIPEEVRRLFTLSRSFISCPRVKPCFNSFDASF